MYVSCAIKNEVLLSSLIVAPTIQRNHVWKISRPIQIGVVVGFVYAVEEQDVGVVRVLHDGRESRGDVLYVDRAESEHRGAAVGDKASALEELQVMFDTIRVVVVKVIDASLTVNL